MDKKTFVSEVYHRVKNNLQMVCSMLRMQMREVESVAAKKALSEAIRRISSLSLTYELISKSGESVDLLFFIRRILEDLVNFSLMPGQKIGYEVNGKEIFLPDCINPVHLSIVLSEIFMNAIKHGFRGVDSGKIEVNVSQKNGEIIIVVIDDGVGLPEDLKEGLGLKLVRGILENDMKGSFKIFGGKEKGTVVVIKVRC